MAHEALLARVFEQEMAALLAIAPWLNTTPRFETFLQTYMQKIRRKVRLCRDTESRHDLLAELAVAWLLVQERRFAVEYERPQANRRGGPDFTATFRTHTVFNVEVKRLRPVEHIRQAEQVTTTRWCYAVCEKLRQLPPAEFNIIALIVEDRSSIDDLSASIKQLKLHAERKDDTFFQKRGLSAADFFTYYARLHGVLVCGYGPDAPYIQRLWFNREARRKLPEDLLRTFRTAVPDG